MIEFQNLCMRYQLRDVLRGISGSVAPGEVCGLIGSNGAGKTTLLRILATILRPSAGTVRIAGCALPDEVHSARRRLGYMPDHLATYDELRVRSFLEFFAHLYDLPRATLPDTVRDVLQLVDLGALGSASIESLSLGARQRLSLGRVLLHNPDVLLLDEPVSGLDPRARVEMRTLLAELGRMGKSILISSHVLGDLKGLCDRYLILEAGEVVFQGTHAEFEEAVAGPPRVSVTVPENREEAFAFLAAQPFTSDVIREAPGEFTVRLRGDEFSAVDVGRALHGAGYVIARLVSDPVDLEEGFLRLTRGVVT